MFHILIHSNKLKKFKKILNSLIRSLSSHFHSILFHQLRQFMFIVRLSVPENIQRLPLYHSFANYSSERNVRGVRTLTVDCEGRRSIAHRPSRPYFSDEPRNIANGRYSPSEYCNRSLRGAARVMVRSELR